MRLRALIEAVKGRATDTSYPIRAEPAPHYRGPPVIDEGLCIGCGACVNACPAGALQIRYDSSDEVYVLEHDIGRCIFCSYCADVCPRNAISISHEYELATSDRIRLVRRVVHEAVECNSCGKAFATENAIIHLISTGAAISTRLLFMCPSCRALRVAKLMALKVKSRA